MYFVQNEEDMFVAVECGEDATVSEALDKFCRFLLMCSYQPKSIVNAIAAKAEELEYCDLEDTIY